jgi:hypothetical protein
LGLIAAEAFGGGDATVVNSPAPFFWSAAMRP